MFKTIAIVAAIAFASVANAQVAQKNSIIVQTGINKVVPIQEKNAVKKHIVHAVYVADNRINNTGARMVGRNYVGTETGIEGLDFNRK
ncbi:MAG: hypothetical protein PHX60_07255 [Giesbergeria sp.]|uniref:hypothetical protein n=1 Tax=Giesbergeria sp. TaxID=2818473 RepID=UPI0026193522|nr:hypothetical protein [Giesbergeria sp.]MDD2609484.1 hypothetical protein [Giesbergeria sp.]